LQVPQAFLYREIQDLNEQGCTTELVFNLERVGIADWEDDALPDEISWNISKGKTYFGDRLYVYCWRITHPLYNYVAECSVAEGFNFEAESKAFHQRENLS
jgi:hypothetical protein